MAGKNKKSESKEVKRYMELLYMTPSEVSAKDISEILQDTPGITAQLWEQMNILELELSNLNSVDFEPIDINFKNPSDAAFVKNRNIKTIFAVNVCETDLNLLISVFEKIICRYSGFLCEDTDDFMPVYAGSSKR